jgi:hypothetical protein
MHKLTYYARQAEYRTAFAANGAFRVYNVETKIFIGKIPLEPLKVASSHPQRTLVLGSMARICSRPCKSPTARMNTGIAG